MLEAENTVYLWIYNNISCIGKNNTANLWKSFQQLFGLTLRENPWLWNWTQT